MATDKRDRQRANREEKKAAEAKTAKRQHRFGVVRKWTIYAVIFIAVILALRYFVG